MTTRKAENMIRIAICSVMLIIVILHPRVIYWITFIICVIRSLICFHLKQEKHVTIMCQEIALSLFGIVFLCYFGQFLNLFWPNHAPYEYKAEIAKCKADYQKRYYHFPDKIPKGAKKVKWERLPSVLQGVGYDKLLFYADQSYLQQIRDTYAEEATLYTYDDYRWTEYGWKEKEAVNKSNHEEQTEHGSIYFSFPLDYSIDKMERNNIELYVLYDNQNTNHPCDSGFYINWTEGYIAFWAE